MNITITIAPAVESAGIQTIARALNVTGTDENCKGHLAAHLKSVVAKLYTQDDRIQREEAENATAETVAETYITTS